MKSNKFKIFFFITLCTSILLGCTKDSDVVVTEPSKTMFAENFNNSSITTTGWYNINQNGVTNWTRAVYKNDGYAKISSYYGGTGHDAVSWLVSPAIDMDTQDGEKLFFQSCQDGFVKNSINSLELYISSNFNGTNFSDADWVKVDCKVATPNDIKFIYVDSGALDLSKYTGKIHFAFKYIGYAASNLNGGYQVDNVRIFY